MADKTCERIRIDIELVNAVDAARRLLNRIPLELVDLYENGKRVNINRQKIDDFRFTGLNNMDFYLMDDWCGEHTPKEADGE